MARQTRSVPKMAAMSSCTMPAPTTFGADAADAPSLSGPGTAQPNLMATWRVDRAFRSVRDGTNSSGGHLRAWVCGLRSLQEPWIDATTPIGEAMFHITIGWAGLEEQTLSERMRAGMERAREEGKQLGRPRRRPLASDPWFAKVHDLVLAGTLTRAEGARRLRVRYGRSWLPWSPIDDGGEFAPIRCARRRGGPAAFRKGGRPEPGHREFCGARAERVPKGFLCGRREAAQGEGRGP
jgi:Resolvase, N terminal domain